MIKQILIAADQLANALLGGYADETISARAWRSNWTWRIAIIDWLFRDPNHCKNSYYAEVWRKQLPEMYNKLP